MTDLNSDRPTEAVQDKYFELSLSRGMKILRPKLRGLRLARLAPRKSMLVLAVLAAVCFAAFGVLWLKNDKEADLEAARSDAVAQATANIATLLSYDYRTLDDETAKHSNIVTGGFKDEYVKLVEKQLAPAAKQNKVVTRTDVVTAAVIKADTRSVELLLFLNQVSATKGSETPVMSGSRAHVSMKLVDGKWKVAGIEPV